MFGLVLPQARYCILNKLNCQELKNTFFGRFFTSGLIQVITV